MSDTLHGPLDEAPASAPETVPAHPDAPRQAYSQAWIAILAYIAFDIGLPMAHIPRHWPGTLAAIVGLVLPTVVFMLLQLWLAWTIVRLRWRPGRAVAGAVGCIALWFAVAAVRVWHGMPLYEVEAVLIAKGAALGLLLTVGLTFLGILLSRIIREPNVLLPIALVAIPIDYVGAMTSLGFTQAVVKHAPQIVSAVSVPVPSMGTEHGLGIHPIGFIGPGDALFIACFFSAVTRLCLNERGTFWWIYALLTLAMVVVLITDLPIAALVPMGIAVIIANFRFFRFKRAEVFAMAYAMALVLVVVGAFYMASRHWLFGGH